MSSIPERIEVRRRDPKERSRDFEEVALGYSADEALAEASRCLQCKKPGCVAGCPAHVDIPGFIEKIKAGEPLEAVRVIKQTNSLPGVCGRVCPQELQCEQACVLAKKGRPVAIGALERYAADAEMREGIFIEGERKAPNGIRAACIGSGPASLTFAAQLARAGFDVTVYEALHKGGGVLVYGIPEFRLPKRIIAREIEYLQRIGVKMEVNFVAGRNATLRELLEKNKIVFVGTGAGEPYFLEVEGEEYPGVYSANEFLTRVNLLRAYQFPKHGTPVKKPRRAVIVGGGNVALDSARSALRLGAEVSTIAYRRSRTEMPARAEEVKNAEEEGIRFDFLVIPRRILGSNTTGVQGIEFLRARLGEPDSSGRRRPVPIPGSEFVIECDMVVIAIGSGPNRLLATAAPELRLTQWGYIEADARTGATSIPGVYAGGDIVTGSATVISAIGAGWASAAEAARSV